MNAPWKSVCFISFLLFLHLCGIAGAQTDSGTILQQQRQPASGLPDRLPDQELKEGMQPQMEDTGAKVLVKGFRFTGSFEGMAADAELQKLVQKSVGSEIGFSHLQKLAARVTQYLREKKGFLLARAYLPKQDVTEGIIEIAILAGRIDGNANVIVGEPSRIKVSRLQGIADQAIPAGSPIRMEQVERAALLMNDLPGVTAGASLEPGTTPGTTRVIIKASEGRLLHGAIGGDNFGDRYTGVARAMGRVSVYSPLGLGDELSASITGAERMLQTQASYAIPLGTAGWTGNIAFTHLSYELGEEMASLESKGGANTIAGSLAYPLLRSRKASLWSSFGAEYLRLDDKAFGLKIRDRRLIVGNFSLFGNTYDAFGGGGLSSANVSVYSGNVNLDPMQSDRISDAAGPRTHGSFVRATYTLARLQRITQALAIFGSVRGQFASGNLDSSQKFILGGPGGIRAYPIGEAPGAEGHAMTFETRLNLPMASWTSTQLVGFLDAGQVKLYRNLWSGAFTNATRNNKYWLSGAGIGINMGKEGLYSLRASYAHRIGDNPGRSFSGKNVDNRKDRGRFWLQLTIWI